MSAGLVKVLALGAGALITYGAAERGIRRGRERGQDKLGEFDANLLMRSTMTTSDDVLVDGIADKLRGSVQYQDGFMGSVVRGWHGLKGAVGEVFKSAVPLGVAGLSFLAASVGAPILGAIGLGGLAIWGGSRVLKASGLSRGNNAQFLDIKM
jgi:hypothetical protein